MPCHAAVMYATDLSTGHLCHTDDQTAAGNRPTQPALTRPLSSRALACPSFFAAMQTLNQLLTELDGFESGASAGERDKLVIVLAATNR